MHSYSWSSEHKAIDRLGTNLNVSEHRTTSEHKSGSEHCLHHSDTRSHSREPLKESRSRPRQLGSKASPASSTHSGYSPVRKDREKEISPFSDEDLIRSSVGRHDSSKKWSHPDDSSHSKHKRSHSKKKTLAEPPLPTFSKKHHREDWPPSGHRGGGVGGGNSEWKNDRGQSSSRGGTPEKKEKRPPSHFHHFPPSESPLHDSGVIMPLYSRDVPTFNGKSDLRRRSYESISDEDMCYEPSPEGNQERKPSYDPERLSKKDRKRRLTDSSEEDHHTVGSGDSRPPPSSMMPGAVVARSKHKKHKSSKEHKETWRKPEHGKDSSGGNKHKHSHHHHKH